MPKQQKGKLSVLGVRARAGARACAASGTQTQPLALRVRKGATAMRWERGNAPIVHATHGNSSCKRGRLGAPALSLRRCCRRPPRAFCLWGSTGARQHVYASQSWLQRPQTLMNNPTHQLLKKKFAQEQRRQRKKGAPRPRAHLHAGGPNRALPSPRKRLDAGAMHMPQQHLHCKNLLQNGGSVSVACARGPLLREDAPPCAAINSLTCAACCTSTHVRLAPSPRLPFCAFPSHASQFAVCL